MLGAGEHFDLSGRRGRILVPLRQQRLGLPMGAVTLVGSSAFADGPSLPSAVYNGTPPDYTAIATSLAVILIVGIVGIQVISLGINAIVNLFSFFKSRVKPRG